MDQNLDDTALWSKALAGEGDAFASIFDRHRARVLRHSVSLTGNLADAEDVLAVAFFEAWRKRNSVRVVDGSILPWLLVTATNTSHNLTRAARRYQQLLARLPVAEDLHDPTANDDGNVAAAMRSLSMNDQRILTVCVIEGLSERSAAAVLGIPPGTVKSRLFRAKKRLAQLITNIPTSEVTPLRGEPYAY